MLDGRTLRGPSQGNCALLVSASQTSALVRAAFIPTSTARGAGRSASAFLPGARSASAQGHHYAEDEAEVVPVPAVEDLVDAHIVGKE